ncbi:2'-5' RNA ligase family protein [Paenibacillus daejeonensis]|uniref:2'-5' RNA ligase family protein n=1 Tax=Paenibacillus daejeonensis TaxID=135193 RepID=UPI000360CA22|nr:2'-5' RNA ligase family protein [Paenibacillus daejeonensis]
MQIGLVIFPSRTVQDFANSWRKRLDPRYSAIQPHLTLRAGLQISEEELAVITTQLEQAAATQPPFSIRYDRASTFYPVSQVIYLALEDPQPVIALREALCTGHLAETSTPYVYTPHVTLGQELSPDELHDVHASIRQSAIDFTDRVDRVHLLYQTANGSWTAYQSFLLRG